MDVEWPSYDVHNGKYFVFEKFISKSSVRQNFCADSYNFWYNLVPKVIASVKSKKDGKSSYFRKGYQDSCESKENCVP